MAQNIRLMGATYNDVPAVLLPKSSGGSARFTDATVTTAEEADVASGKTFIKADGSIGTGSASGGGGSNYTLVHEMDVTANTTSTSATSLTTYTNTQLWTTDKIVYVRIRDKAGKRAGYFYGSDTYFMNYNKANGSTSAITTAARLIHRYSTSSQWGTYVGATTTGYGLYGYDINSSGRLRIYTRYNSNYSLTINGTYHVEIYLLDWPDGVSPFSA